MVILAEEVQVPPLDSRLLNPRPAELSLAAVVHSTFEAQDLEVFSSSEVLSPPLNRFVTGDV
eukprot:6117347-Karenia_brevis.AAC.1